MRRYIKMLLLRCMKIAQIYFYGPLFQNKVTKDMEKNEQFQGIINGYNITVVASSTILQFHYSLDAHPNIPYEAVFYKNIEGSTNPEAARMILSHFRSFKRCLHYIIDFQEDQKRIQIVDGQFSIWVFKTKLKPKRCPLIRFQGQLLLDKAQKQEELKAQKQVMSITEQNTYLKQTLKKLQGEHQRQGNLIKQLRKQIIKDDRKYVDYLKRDTYELDGDEEFNPPHKRQRIKQLKNTLGLLGQTLKGLLKKVEQQQVKLPPPQIDEQESFQFLEKYGKRHWVVIDMNNKYIPGNFQIKDNVLKKIGRYGSYQILGRDPFILSGRHFYSVYLNRIHYSAFSLGIINQNRRNHKVSHQSPEIVSFYGREGTVWQDGGCRGGGPPVRDGVEIRVVVDFMNKLIKWYIKGVEIASTYIGKQLLDLRLVPYIQINYPDDYVTFNTRGQEEEKEEKKEGVKLN